MIRTIERATGNEFQAKRIEGGYKVYTLAGEPYKKLKESTFKRYFKVLGEAAGKKVEPQPKVSDDDYDEPEQPTTKAEKLKKEKATEKKQEKKSPKKEQPVVELDDVTKENMIEKIKKILNLSKNNSSVEEAASAALQAQKLMAKYNIHEDEVTLEELKGDEIGENTVELNHSSHLLAWYKNLAVVVAENFRVKTYLDAKRDVVFRGFTEDTKIAQEVYRYLYTLGNKLAGRAYAEAKNNTGTAKGVYNSFVVGYLTGIKEALNEQCVALMIVTPKAVEEDYAIFSQNLEAGRKHTLKARQGKAYEDDKREGKAAVKSRQLTDKKNKGGKKS